MKAFAIMGRVLKAAYDDLFLCVFLSAIWWAFPIILVLLFGALGEYAGGLLETLPTPAGLTGLGVALLLLLIVQPLVTLGVQHVANRIANYRRADSGFFWEGTRQNRRHGFLLFAFSLLIPAAIGFNVWFYFNSEGMLKVIGVVWLWLFLFALMAGQYLFPLLWQQDQPSVRMALRNAALLALQNPLYSLFMLIFQLALIIICFALTLPMLLLGPALIALAGNFALVGLLQDMGLAPQPPEAPTRG
ncbi:MAG: hypothetical protein KJZ93_14130 [Caldilineaceae bacterium]|nr:hypothetical protein [Caldilineaceae bacterium]